MTAPAKKVIVSAEVVLRKRDIPASAQARAIPPNSYEDLPPPQEQIPRVP